MITQCTIIAQNRDKEIKEKKRSIVHSLLTAAAHTSAPGLIFCLFEYILNILNILEYVLIYLNIFEYIEYICLNISFETRLTKWEHFLFLNNLNF